MSKKKSLLWDYFDEETVDPTNAICKVDGCPKKISRGKTGTLKSRLSNTGMRTHLRTCHVKEWAEFLKKEEEQVDAQAKTEKEKDETCETEELKCQSLNWRAHRVGITSFSRIFLI